MSIEAIDRGDLPPNWDPEKKERTWVHHVQTGDRGWFVKRNGKTVVHLDRPVEALRPTDGFVIDTEYRPLNRTQIAKVQFAADQELCKAMGIRLSTQKTWADLTSKEKILWLNEGPDDPVQRAKLFKFIHGAIGDLAR